MALREQNWRLNGSTIRNLILSDSASSFKILCRPHYAIEAIAQGRGAMVRWILAANSSDVRDC